MPKLGEAAQIRILGLLAERGDESALPAFTTAIKGPSKPVRVAALQGIGKVGNASIVTSLAGIATSENPAEQTAARGALAAIPGKPVDQAIVEGLAGADPKPGSN